MDGGVEVFETAVSDIQTGVSVTGDKITGTLKWLTEGAIPDYWGDGNFIVLAFDNFSTGLTYANVKVGLHNSAGSGLVTLDSDKMAVMKITDKNNQKVMVVQTNSAGVSHTQYFDLSGLTLETE